MKILTTLAVIACSISVYASNETQQASNKVKLISSTINSAEDTPQLTLPNGMPTRSIDGTGNNLANPTWGSTGERLLRIAPVDYADGISALGGAGRPSARAISNAVHAENGDSPNPAGASDYLWQWGQFLDHDIDLTDLAEPLEFENIEVPAGDMFFDPGNTGTQIIGFERSEFDLTTGTDVANPRQQINVITAYIDASNVYGSDPVRAATLRSNDGSGRLRTSAGDLLPFNTTGLPNAGGEEPELFLAGDVRANEQAGLAVMHTLFVREHNRLATEIALENPGLSGDEIYEWARAIVGAQMQVITYNEFLPLLLGPGALLPYSGYDDTVNASIANEFSTAAYRLGHTMLSDTLLRRDARGLMIEDSDLSLRDAFFNPDLLVEEGGIEPILRGLAGQEAQDVDAAIVDDVRNFLFGPPGAGGFDLPALNIQRGRDHGLASYNDIRIAYGLPAVAVFSDITADADLQAALASVYANVDEIDAWTGMLAEDDVAGGGLVGELLQAVLADQFERLRDGDRFWYQLQFSGDELAELESTTLADIIRRNTTIDADIPDAVFIAGSIGIIPQVPALGRIGLLLTLLLILAMGAAFTYQRKAT